MARAAQRAVATPLSARRAPAAARRSMGGHARHIGLPGEHVPIEVNKVHKTLGTVYLTTMFLWMMYRAKEDGLVLLVSFSRTKYYYTRARANASRSRAFLKLLRLICKSPLWYGWTE